MGIATGSIFENNRTQAVRLPAETRFPPEVRKVACGCVGGGFWRRSTGPGTASSWRRRVSEDFLPERASQQQDEREAF